MVDKSDLIELFDTTLRDGTQAEGVNVSIHDKLNITKQLDAFGIDIIEGGWPGSNPKDKEYFQKIRLLDLKHARITAFGSTARFPDKVESDANLNALIEAETPVVSIFGKTWRFHSEKSLGLTDAQNEELIFKSVKFLKDHGRHVVFDAEHFFDGYKDDADFAIRMLKAAEQGGADVLVLCDTNGGTLPGEVARIVQDVKMNLNKPLGIHAHNDGDLGVANTLAAVEQGVRHVQGTINGIGERCGNANLATIIPNLYLKMGLRANEHVKLDKITSLSHFIYEVTNMTPNNHMPYVGKSAFAHKGGIHVSSVLKDSRMYEHVDPSTVGNKQTVVVSDLSGQSNIRYKAEKLGIELPEGRDFSSKFVQDIKTLEYEGLQFDGAEASFELLLRSELNHYQPYFEITYSKVNVMFNERGDDYSEAVLKVKVGDEEEHTAADGDGPVNALDNAMRKALTRFYPEIADMHLVDYKVRVLGEQNGTGAKVRVLVESSDNTDVWSTVGVSTNIIKASLQALSDAMNYRLYHYKNSK
ncbi:citramalate synthase [candidate division KSB1 bacterium]|nr:citramalate synthase [candidate division KSB1 bacterium]